MNPGYEDSFSRANIFRCYAVLVQASYKHVMSLLGKLTYLMYLLWGPVETLSILTLAFTLTRAVF